MKEGIRLTGHVAGMDKKIHAYRILVETLQWKKPLRRPRRRHKENIERVS
jgi:hypothetical protein